MIIKAKHNFFIHNFFKFYTIYKIKKCFDKVMIINKIEIKNNPLLLISNHIGWWDGFWAMYLNLKLFKKKFHFMMLEGQLKKFRFFNYSGGFSVNKNSKSVLETINYTLELLTDKNNMVLIFPQGKINSIYQNNIKFENGINHIVKKLNTEIQIIFVANFIEYFSEPSPSLYMYLEDVENFNEIDIEKHYQKFYNNCFEQQRILIS